MTWLSSGLSCYFEMNLLLLFGFLILKLGRSLSARFTGLTGYQFQTRLAQGILLISLFSPLLLRTIPQEHLRPLQFEARNPIAESLASAKMKKTTAEVLPASVEQAVPVLDTPLSFFHSLATWLRETSAWLRDTQARLRDNPKNWVMPVWSRLAKDMHAQDVIVFLLFFITVAFLRLARGAWILRKVLREAISIRRIGKVVVRVSDGIAVPFSTLLSGKAEVIIPADLILRVKDLRIAIRHELQHHRQRDTAWALFIEVLACLFPLNPSVYGWKKEIAELQEFSCDEALIGRERVSAHDYGSCLVRVAEAALGRRQMQVGTACMAAPFKNPKKSKPFLRRRIEMFRQHKNLRRKKIAGLLLGTVFTLTTLTAAYGAHPSFQSSAPDKVNPGRAAFDPNIQAIAEEILQKHILKDQARGGFVLVSDPQTGRLLAAANFSSAEKPLGVSGKAWSLAFLEEPASIMKGLTAAVAIDQGLTTPDEKLNCENGKYNYGGHVFRDWKPFAHLTTAETVAQSSNICGIKIGEKLGVSGLSEALVHYGFGPHGTTEGFPEALSGKLPDPGNGTPEADYIPLVATGYNSVPGFYITPLEAIQAYGAIANGGNLMQALQATDADSAVHIVRRVMSTETAQQMKAILASTVTSGIGFKAQSRLYSTAGKTSSAFSPESPQHDDLGGERGVAGFIGFAPLKNPRIAIYVGIIEPKSSKDHNPHGNEHAAPVFREVVEKVLQYEHVAPDLGTKTSAN